MRAGSQTTDDSGSYVPTAAVACTPCALGRFSGNSTGAAECAVCESGSQTEGAPFPPTPCSRLSCLLCARACVSSLCCVAAAHSLTYTSPGQCRRQRGLRHLGRDSLCELRTWPVPGGGPGGWFVRRVRGGEPDRGRDHVRLHRLATAGALFFAFSLPFHGRKPLPAAVFVGSPHAVAWQVRHVGRDGLRAVWERPAQRERNWRGGVRELRGGQPDGGRWGLRRGRRGGVCALRPGAVQRNGGRRDGLRGVRSRQPD